MNLLKSPKLIAIALISVITLSACESKKQKDYGYTSPLDTPVFQKVSEQQTAVIDSSDKMNTDTLSLISTDSIAVNNTLVSP